MTHNGGSRHQDDWRREYGADGREISRTAPGVGIWGPWSRPPLGPPVAGRRATAGGRGNRECQSDAWRAWRFAMAYAAWRMRIERGAHLAEIARALGVSRTVIGRWLYGCPALTLRPEPGDRALDALLSGLPPRPVLAPRTLSARTGWQERALRDMTR